VLLPAARLFQRSNSVSILQSVCQKRFTFMLLRFIANINSSFSVTRVARCFTASFTYYASFVRYATSNARASFKSFAVVSFTFWTSLIAHDF
jgi:hypothetical protein